MSYAEVPGWGAVTGSVNVVLDNGTPPYPVLGTATLSGDGAALTFSCPATDGSYRVGIVYSGNEATGGDYQGNTTWESLTVSN